MSVGKETRLRRLFSHPSGRFMSVAVDHFIGYTGRVPPGLRDLANSLAQIVDARPDALTLHKGALVHSFRPYAGRVPTIVQTGLFRPDDSVRCTVAAVEEVVRLGGDAIAHSIGVYGPHEQESIDALARTVEAAARYDLPVVAHIYPRRYDGAGPAVSHDPVHLYYAMRVGWELGADLIKIPYCGSVDAYRDVVQSCPVPVVAAGGPETATFLEALQMADEVVQAGARGATVGRNVWGQSNIAGAVRAFKAVIHDRVDPREAVAQMDASA